MPSRVTTIPVLVLLVTAYGVSVTRYDTVGRRRISYIQAARACNHYTFKLKIMLYMEMLFIL